MDPFNKKHSAILLPIATVTFITGLAAGRWATASAPATAVATVDSPASTTSTPVETAANSPRSSVPADEEVVTTVAPAAVRTMQLRVAPGAVRWLHIPKTGSAFINVLARYACHGVPKNTTFAMAHDFNRWMSSSAVPRCVRLLPPWVGHAPTRSVEVQPTGSRRVLVALFRRPAQRLLSGFHHVEGGVQAAFAPGMTPARRAEMQRAIGSSAAKYARWPGVAGCMTKMLLGLPCASTRPLRQPNATRAALVVRERLRFVGLTDEWERSVCLFHAMLRGGAPALPTELARTHVGVARPRGGTGAYDEASLDGFVDRHDEVVYAAARQRFADDLKRVGTCGRLPGAS